MLQISRGNGWGSQGKSCRGNRLEFPTELRTERSEPLVGLPDERIQSNTERENAGNLDAHIRQQEPCGNSAVSHSF